MALATGPSRNYGNVEAGLSTGSVHVEPAMNIHVSEAATAAAAIGSPIFTGRPRNGPPLCVHQEEADASSPVAAAVREGQPGTCDRAALNDQDVAARSQLSSGGQTDTPVMPTAPNGLPSWHGKGRRRSRTIVAGIVHTADPMKAESNAATGDQE